MKLTNALQNIVNNTHMLRSGIRANWGWIARLIILVLLLVRLQPAEPHAILDEPHHVETEQPHLCVHTRLIDEVEEWKIQESLRLVREMGADHIVEFFPWAYVERTPGNYDWVIFDRIMKHAENQGIQVIARMGYVPEWAQIDPETSTLNTLPERSYANFATFVADFAERYQGIADEIIIWNEPNLAFEWGYQQIDPAGYVRMLETVYPAAHTGNPDVTVLVAGLAPTLEPPGSLNGLADDLYLRAIYEHGGGDYFDGIALHTYGFTEPATSPPAPNKLNFRRAELLHEIMVEYGDGDKPIYITETGWNDYPGWVFSVRPSQRAINTIEALELAAQWEWLDQMCIWMLRTPAPINSHQDGYTMITSAFQPKAIYYAVQSYGRGWERKEQLWYDAPTAR